MSFRYTPTEEEMEDAREDVSIYDLLEDDEADWPHTYVDEPRLEEEEEDEWPENDDPMDYDWLPDPYYGWDMNPYVHPAFPEFYEGKHVVKDASELYPGLVVTEYHACSDPSLGGLKWRIDSYPYSHVRNQTTWVAVTELSSTPSKIPWNDELSLSDHGIMADGRAPYNLNRLVIDQLDIPPYTNEEIDQDIDSMKRVREELGI